MSGEEFLDKIIEKYESTFDMYRPYEFREYEFDAYGYFCAHTDKYVLSKEARLWEADSFEHVFFIYDSEFDMEKINHFISFSENEGEEYFIRKENKYPDKNHMYTYMTLVFISDNPLPDDVAARIRKYRFSRNYMMSFRGWMKVRTAAVSLSDNTIICNGEGKTLQKFYGNILKTSTPKALFE